MVKIAASLILGGCYLAVSGASILIGTVRSTGYFTVDGSAVQGNGTLFSGNTIETLTSQSRIRLNNLDFALYPDSRARIYADHTTLEKGSGVVTGSTNYSLEAHKIRIASQSEDSVWQVAVNGPDRIAVASRKGNAEVRNSNGILLAVVRPGMALAFSPQAGGANASVQLSGTVQVRNGNYFINDVTTKKRIELRGDNLSQYVGKPVQINGSVIPGATPNAEATQVVQVVNINVYTAPGTSAGAGLGPAATGAIIGGVAAAGTIIGLAASGEFSGSGTVSPTSAPSATQLSNP
jgi:hypothetical protein